MAILERFFTFNVFTALLISLFPVGQNNQNAVEHLKKLRSQAEIRMSARIVEEKGFLVTGIAVSTSNSKEMSADAMIGKQWARMTSDAGVPSGMVMKKIQGGKFAVFTTERGPGPKVVPETWRRINSLPKSSVGGDRLYQADFEVYDQRAADPQNLQADVYVGIR